MKKQRNDIQNFEIGERAETDNFIINCVMSKDRLIRRYTDVFSDNTEDVGCEYVFKERYQYNEYMYFNKGDKIILVHKDTKYEQLFLADGIRGTIAFQKPIYKVLRNVGKPLKFTRLVDIRGRLQATEKYREQKHILYDKFLDYMKHLGLLDKTLYERAENEIMRPLLIEFYDSMRNVYNFDYVDDKLTITAKGIEDTKRKFVKMGVELDTQSETE